MAEQKSKISWTNTENGQVCSLTGTKSSVECIAEAVTFCEGNKDVKIEAVKP